jgi:nucleoside-diphosphate-sugar epimerase
MAARTDTNGDNINDYYANTKGTVNVLEAIKSTLSVERVIITSTQFVHQYKGEPKHDEDYAPHTPYGESKVLTEKFTREADLPCAWTIIRPTNIWGPWHPRYPREFWLVLKKGRYLHPGKQPVMRMYGYVGNVVEQILKIFELPQDKVNGKMFYVGDQSVNLLDWVNGFSQKLLGRNVTIVPRLAVRSMALIGDIFAFLGITFPITLSRYRSMTTDNEVSMDETFELLGSPPYPLQDGIEETVKWLVEHVPQYRPISAR